MDWRPVQGVPRLSPDDRWDRLQPTRDPTDGISGYRKWMDGIAYHRDVHIRSLRAAVLQVLDVSLLQHT